MGKKCKCPPAGAPDWVMTYGDMMSLLLTFFIILVALSQIKTEDQYHAYLEEIKKAFGMLGGSGKASITDMPATSLIKRLDEVMQIKREEVKHSNTDDPGIEGEDPQVTRVREGMLFTQGGRITFEPGSADLSDEAKVGLAGVADLVRGYNNKIEVRGHASTMELGIVSAYPDLWSLSFARAKAVMNYLISDAVGIRPERIRLIATSEHEPLAKRVYSLAEQAPNRRAEILVMEALIEDFTKPDSSASAN